MSFRIGPILHALPAMLCLLIAGCSPLTENQTDEQKDPYIQTGKNRRKNLDYKGALEAFEKALEANPRSASAHYELAVIYDEHDNDYAAALYHYNRVLQLRPNSYPADNARQRIEVCKQELAKSVSIAPMLQTMQRDMTKLAAENQQLKKQLEAAQLALAGRPTSPPPAVNFVGQNQPASRSITSSRVDVAAQARTNLSLAGAGALATHGGKTSGGSAFKMKTHTVGSGDTPTSIARKYGVKLSALMAANPSLEPKRLKPGQVVNIPAP